MLEAEVPIRNVEYTRVPCEVSPEDRQGRAADLSDIAMVLTVERCYPGAIDAALEADDTYHGIYITRFVQDKYSQALFDFGFAQARGLELGMLVRSVMKCESKAGNACKGCPLTSLGDDFAERIAGLKDLAKSRGLTDNEFLQIYRWSAQAAEYIPEAYEENLPTENALALLTHEC